MEFTTWGLTGSLTTADPTAMDAAVARLRYWLDEFDLACNRFASSSELSRLNARPGEPVPVSATLERAVDAALEAASMTDGLCDPTVLPALLAWGYDRDYDEVRERVDLRTPTDAPIVGVRGVELDHVGHTVRLSPGCQLDLGASAKALVADLVADDVSELGGAVVEIGGDVAVRGAGPRGPWVVGLSDRLTIRGDEPRVAIVQGGVATSSLTTRTWRVEGRVVSHIIDPRTGRPADGPYATATIAAASCVTANAFATAALLWGDDAAYHVAQAGWSGRLVRRDGTVEFVGGWPEEDPAS